MWILKDSMTLKYFCKENTLYSLLVPPPCPATPWKKLGNVCKAHKALSSMVWVASATHPHGHTACPSSTCLKQTTPIETKIVNIYKTKEVIYIKIYLQSN